MSNRFAKGSRDANEPRLLKIAQQYGYADWDQIKREMIAPEHVTRFYQKCDDNDGHDVNFFDEFGCFTVEIKTDEWEEWARKLKPNEILFRDVCKNVGIPYHIVVTEEQISELFASRKLSKA